MLYIDGGLETFTDVVNNMATNTATQIGTIVAGYSEYISSGKLLSHVLRKTDNYLIRVDTGSSWDWKTNISENTIVKTANPQTGITPPVLANGALFHGTEDDNNIYLFGGTTSFENTSFPGYQQPSLRVYNLWSYNIISKEWNHYDISQGVPFNRPSSGSSSEARDQGLAFFLNGELDSGSSLETTGLGDGNTVWLGGMIVINTNNQTARNVSTYGLSPDRPRTRGLLQYIIGVGSNGIMVQIGGNQKPLSTTVRTDAVGDLVSNSSVWWRSIDSKI